MTKHFILHRFQSGYNIQCAQSRRTDGRRLLRPRAANQQESNSYSRRGERHGSCFIRGAKGPEVDSRNGDKQDTLPMILCNAHPDIPKEQETNRAFYEVCT